MKKIFIFILVTYIFSCSQKKTVNTVWRVFANGDTNYREMYLDYHNLFVYLNGRYTSEIVLNDSSNNFRIKAKNIIQCADNEDAKILISKLLIEKKIINVTIDSVKPLDNIFYKEENSISAICFYQGDVFNRKMKYYLSKKIIEKKMKHSSL